MPKNIILWIDTPVNQRAPIDALTWHKGCQAAVRHGRWRQRRWWPCSSGLWCESAYFCYHHRHGDASRFEKPVPWWKRIKLQAPVKWGKR